MRVEIYSDVVCPWCYIGERRFTRALAEREAGAEVQRALAGLLFAVRFTRGESAGSPAVLARLAGEAGLDAGRAAAMLASDEGEREVRAAVAHARRIGVTAAPTFVFGGEYAVQGAQPPEVFREVREELAGRAAR